MNKVEEIANMDKQVKQLLDNAHAAAQLVLADALARAERAETRCGLLEQALGKSRRNFQTLQGSGMWSEMGPIRPNFVKECVAVIDEALK